MLHEALKFLSDQAVAARGPHIINREAEPSHVYFVGEERRVAEAFPRNHVAADLRAIVLFAQNNDPDAVVWYSKAGVVCLLDDGTRRDRVSLPLTFSPQLKRIISWGDKSPPMKQRDLILMLRTMFKRNLTQAPTLIDAIRVVRFSASKVADSSIAAGRSSIGSKIEQEVTGAGGIPDEFYFNVPIFEEPFGHVEGMIDVALEVDGGTENFVLHPMPGTIAKQVALAEEAIGAKLREELGDGKVFYGSPTVTWNVC